MAAKQKETLFKERVKKRLKTLPQTWHVKIQQVAIRGIPDLLLCMRGQFIALELKRSDKEKPDPLQTWTLEQIAHAGGWSFTACPENWDAVWAVLEHLAHGRAQEAAEAADELGVQLVGKESGWMPPH